MSKQDRIQTTKHNKVLKRKKEFVKKYRKLCKEYTFWISIDVREDEVVIDSDYNMVSLKSLEEC